MSCKVSAVTGDLAAPEGRAKAIAWWRKYGFTKIWLESYRHGVAAPSELLAEERDAFRAEGLEVCASDILPSAKAANPKAHLIIKYPCWYRHYAERGYDPARQAALFGECWIGTETRDANPEPLQACWIMAWMDALTEGRCGGGWYDALDCSPEKFVEQAGYTILGGAKESLVHCYDYLLADDPGRTPFGEKSDRSHACRKAFEGQVAWLRALADRVRGAERLSFEMLPSGVSSHLFRKNGEEFRIEMKCKMREER